jgi:mannose-1-phosphate guanylyltransferase
MARERLRALVLSAGLGTRLRPLTDSFPKPLLPVAGTPILGHTLDALAAVGCEAAAINLHYQADEIRRAFGDVRGRLPLTYSEEPELLGTLGALHPLRGFLAEADVILLVNGDSLCRWPFRALLAAHRRNRSLATLLLASRPDPEGFGGGVGVDRQGRIVSLRRGDGEPREAARRLVFSGAHALSPKILERVGPGFHDIVRDLYAPLLVENPESLAMAVTDRPWHDMGTPRRFLAGALDWAGRGGWTAPSATVDRGAGVRRSVVEAGATVEAGARIEGSVLLPGASVEAGSAVRGSIVGPGATVPAAANLDAYLTARSPERGALGRFLPLSG